jgi:aryl-alcohol dehydrogenase-like predicted oxidoreductase
MLSCHRRATFEEHAKDPAWSALMVRYNAAHPGAEQDVFPLVQGRTAGMVAYTATCWGRLLNPALQPKGEPLPRGSDCYRFALSHPDVSCVLAGPRDRTELDEALSAIERGPMDEGELAWMKRVGAAVR